MESSLTWLSMLLAASMTEHCFPDNPLDDRVSFFQHKVLTSMSMKVTVKTRANLVRSDLEKRVEELDARHPGSILVQELQS
jgi:hypothetical protein